jgi:hypothetical protein
MKGVRRKLNPRTYLRWYVVDYLFSNVIAYGVIVVFLGAVSGYGPE